VRDLFFREAALSHRHPPLLRGSIMPNYSPYCWRRKSGERHSGA
jgi:hypothetical protein